MKAFLVLLCCLSTIVSFANDTIAKLLCKSEWYPEKINRGKDNKKAILRFAHSFERSDATGYLFKFDNNFFWSDSPSCGTNLYATHGEGIWKLEKEDILILNFKNTMTEQNRKRNIEKYKIISITEKELVLKRTQ